MNDLGAIRDQARIEEIINEYPEFELEQKGGRYLKARGHSSFVVDVHKQLYNWNSRGEAGSVFDFVMKRENCDFKTAVEIVCRKSGQAAPKWRAEDDTTRKISAERAKVFTAAAGVFGRWLAGDADARNYAAGRGWTGETIAKNLGYAGFVDPGLGSEEKAERYRALRQEVYDALVLADCDPWCPAAVALTGYHPSNHPQRPSLEEWAKKYDVALPKIEKGWIGGLIGRGMVVYFHKRYEKVEYFSGRGIYAKEHYNLPVWLAGEKLWFYNEEYGNRANTCYIVEGQADAVSLGQLGIAAVAIAGVDVANEQADRFRNQFKGHKRVFVALDDDQGGQVHIGKVCEAIHPLTSVLRWPKEYHGHEIKDANDLLLAMIDAGDAVDEQRNILHALELNSLSYIEEAAAEVGKTQDRTKRDSRELEVVQLYLQLDEIQRDQYRDRVITGLKRKVRDFDRLVKRMEGKDADDGDKPDEIIPIWGGFHDGWLFEYLYEPSDNTAVLAYRDPEGKIGKAAYVDVWVNGTRKRYCPEEPYEFVQVGSIQFPTRIGEHVDQRELVEMIAAFIERYFLFDDPTLPRVIAYYVLLTWMYDAFNAICYLRVLGPSGSGKSMLTERVGWLCYRRIKSMGADTPAVMFRTIAMFGGTLVIDEYDQLESDTTANFIKVLNSGAMKGGVTNRLTTIKDAAGNEKMVPMPYTTFCPKVLNGRADPKDDALINRCITLRLLPKTALEMLANNIPFDTNETFRVGAVRLQNLLLRWRLENWQPEIEVTNEDIDVSISARMNQVTSPMKALARISGDADLKADLEQLMASLYQQEVMNRTETLDARVIEAIWKIFLYEGLHTKFIESAAGELMLYPGNVAEVVNQLIDTMNRGDADEGNDEDDKKKRNVEVSGRKVGAIMKGELQLKRDPQRTTRGIRYAWHEMKMISHAMRYGLDWRREVGLALTAAEVPEAVRHLAERHEIEADHELRESALLSDDELKLLRQAKQKGLI